LLLRVWRCLPTRLFLRLYSHTTTHTHTHTSACGWCYFVFASESAWHTSCILLLLQRYISPSLSLRLWGHCCRCWLTGVDAKLAILCSWLAWVYCLLATIE
jgi:hypothetical protein